MPTKQNVIVRWSGKSWIKGTSKEISGKRFEIKWTDGTSEVLTKLKSNYLILDKDPLLDWFLSHEVGQINAWLKSPPVFAMQLLEVIGEAITPNDFKKELNRLKIPKESLSSHWSAVKQFLEANDHVLISGKPVTWSWSSNPLPKNSPVSNLDLLRELYLEKSGENRDAHIKQLKKDIGSLTSVEKLLAWGIGVGEFPNVEVTLNEIPSWGKERIALKVLESEDFANTNQIDLIERFVPNRELAAWMIEGKSELKSKKLAATFLSKSDEKTVKALLNSLNLKLENALLAQVILETLSFRDVKFLESVKFLEFFVYRIDRSALFSCDFNRESILKFLALTEGKVASEERALTLELAIKSKSISIDGKRSIMSLATLEDWKVLYSEKSSRQAINESVFRNEVVLPSVSQLLEKSRLRDQLVAALALPSALTIDLEEEYRRLVKRVCSEDRQFGSLFIDEVLHEELQEQSVELNDIRARLTVAVTENDSLQKLNDSLEFRINELMQDNLRIQAANMEALSGELNQASIDVVKKWSLQVTQAIRDVTRLAGPEKEKLILSIVDSCRQAGLIVVGIPGDEVEIVPEIHDLLGTSSNGRGIVSDPGYKWVQNNNELLMARALVIPAE